MSSTGNQLFLDMKLGKIFEAYYFDTYASELFVPDEVYVFTKVN